MQSVLQEAFMTHILLFQNIDRVPYRITILTLNQMTQKKGAWGIIADICFVLRQPKVKATATVANVLVSTINLGCKF